jgi:hypothetical protein
MDLRAAAWLALAWQGGRAFAGLAQGVGLLARLTALSWAELHPPLKRIDLRLAWYAWWAAEAHKAVLGLDPAAAPRFWDGRRIFKGLAFLESFLDQAAPGFEPTLAPLAAATRERLKARWARARKRVAGFFAGFLGLLAITLALAFGWLAGQALEEPDELAGYRPCPASPKEAGPPPQVGRYFSHYDREGRLVVFLSLNGYLPKARLASDLTGPRPVTALDFPGLAVPQGRRATPGPGPAIALSWGRHPGFGRLAVSYRPENPPAGAKVQILCRESPWGQEAAIRISFRPPKARPGPKGL